jgi:hypothetical protein
MAQFESIRFQPQRPLLRELSADRLNTILQEIRRNKPKGERGITVRQSGDGTYIGLAASLPAAKGGVAATRQPWDLIATPDPESTAENPPYKIRVQPGTLNGILPSNWDTEFDAAATGLHYAKAVVATDGESITGVTIEINTTPPRDQAPVEFGIESSIDYLFGLFFEGSTFRVIGNGSISIRPRIWFVVSASPPAQPGESPFDIYYNLS